jgi:biotin carboxylase
MINPSSPRPLILLVGSGAERYRGYLMRSLSRRHDLWLLTSSPSSWSSGYVCGTSLVDVSDPVAALAAARSVSATRPVAGVVCWDEALIVTAAHVAVALDLPGMSPAAVEACRDKHQTRTRLAAAGVPQAASLLITSAADARAAARRIGYPAVIKPRGLGASRGVIRVDSDDALDDAYAQARAASYPGVPVYRELLIEEYLDGPEISVDGFTYRGQYIPIFVAHKEVGLAPYFEETGHVVTAGDPLLTDAALSAVLQGAHQALGIEHGMTHAELRLTATGPRVIEVNGRLGGDLIPYLGLLATGIDPAAIAASLAMNRRPCYAPTRRRTAAIRFLYPTDSCRVDAVEVATGHGQDGTLIEVAALVEPGAILRLPPDGYVARFGYVLACAGDGATCRRALDEAERHVRLQSSPLARLDGIMLHAT